MGNSESDLSNAAGSSNEELPPKKKEETAAKLVAAAKVAAAVVVGVGALAVWAANKYESSSSSGSAVENVSSSSTGGWGGDYGNPEMIGPGYIPEMMGSNDGWRFPAGGKLKMNIDGSVKNSETGIGGQAGFGGIIRNERGSWILGFYGRLENCHSADAEYRAIYRGLQFIQDRKFREVEIESDLESAVNVINGKAQTKKPSIKEKVEQCKVILQRTGCKLNHVKGEANKIADKMAYLGMNQVTDFVLFTSPPYPNQRFQELLDEDIESATSV